MILSGKLCLCVKTNVEVIFMNEAWTIPSDQRVFAKFRPVELNARRELNFPNTTELAQSCWKRKRRRFCVALDLPLAVALAFEMVWSFCLRCERARVLRVDVRWWMGRAFACVRRALYWWMR